MALEGEMEVSIDTQKIEEDAKWNELKGCFTNTSLSETEVIKSYNLFCNIEVAFRVSKSDLRIRTIYHQLQRRLKHTFAYVL